MLEYRYGITVERYEEMYAKQEGHCSICKQWFRVLSVDHDHKTKQVRKLLCRTCNLKLQGFEDDIFASAAQEYLDGC